MWMAINLHTTWLPIRYHFITTQLLSGTFPVPFYLSVPRLYSIHATLFTFPFFILFAEGVLEYVR